MITRGIKALCPAQRWDEYTPDVWLQVLRKVRYAEAAAAVERLGARQPWIGPSDISKAVDAVHKWRIDRVNPMPNDVEGVSYLDELRTVRAAVAEGRMTAADVEAYNRWGGSLFLESQRTALGPAGSSYAARGEIDG
jgi:hypothetical protein